MNKKNGNSSKSTKTFGNLFGDGSAIDRLRGGDLVFRQDGQEMQGSSVAYGGHVFEGASLHPSLEACFPTHAEDFGTVGNLMATLEQRIVSVTGLNTETAFLLALFAASTWVSDCLPALPLLNAWGVGGADTLVGNILWSLYRRSLRLLRPTVTELLRLPQGFAPTLLVQPIDTRAQGGWLAAVTGNGSQILRKGGIVNLRYPVAVLSRQRLVGVGLSLPVLPASSRPRMLPGDMRKLADEFQPWLLAFRLQRHLQVTASYFPAPNFSSDIQAVAVALGATLEAVPQLQARLLEVLKARDEDEKARCSQDPTAIVLEALLACCHEGHERSLVGDIAELATAILLGRKDTMEISARGVGEILRHKVGLFAKRGGLGYAIRLDASARLLVHRLAYSHGTLSLSEPFPGCSYCQDLLQDEASAKASSNVHDLHTFTNGVEVRDGEEQ